jgi:hypothetical protein
MRSTVESSEVQYSVVQYSRIKQMSDVQPS